MSSLKKQVASGVKWSTLSQLGRQGTQLLTTIILARLLSPSDFGLVGMAMVVIGFTNIFKDLGTSAAIIQKKDLNDDLMYSIFFVNVIFGVIGTLILFLSAPLVGNFYNEPRVVPVLKVLSINFFISSFAILHQAILERSLAFRKLAKLEIISVFAGSIIGITLALLGYGVWSLVFQSITAIFISTLLLWFYSTWRPKWVFQWKEIKSVSNYSLSLTGFNIVNYFARNADYLLIGRYLGSQALGYYTLAYKILLFPLQNISGVIGRVVFPAFSSIQDENKRLSITFLKIASTIALISFPLMLGVIALSKPFILIIFGSKWAPVIILIIILAPVGLVQSVGTTVGPIYQAKGKTSWLFGWGFGSSIFVIVGFLIGLNWGLIGIATSYTIASILLVYPNFSIPFKLIDLSFTQLIENLKIIFFNSLTMFLVVIVIQLLLSKYFKMDVVFIISILLGTSVYLILSWINNNAQLKELWMLVKQKVT